MKIYRYIALACLLVYPVTHVSAGNAQRTLILDRGSDSMGIAVMAWAEEYKHKTRTTGLAVSGGGTGTGIAALINGTVDIANASRPMNRREINLSRAHGIAPVQHTVGYDAIAIYVHRDNPVESLTFSRLGDIFGEGGEIETWADLGITVPGCNDQKIIRVGRQSSSGTYAYLRENVVGGDRYRQGTLEAQSSKDLIELVAKTPCAIGYSSFAYATPDVKVVCISESPGDPCLKPTIKDVAERTYPISRPLYMYTKTQASGDVRRYLDWVLSDEGQCILLNHSYAPVRDVGCE